MTTQKPVLVWDFDDVLFPFMEAFFVRFHNQHYRTSFTYEEVVSYELEKVLKCEYAEKQRRIDEFYLSEIHHGMLPIEGAFEAVRELSMHYQNVIVTARPSNFELQTRTLLNRHYTGMFEEKIHFLHHYSPVPQPRASKGEKCIEIGAVACIEDALHNAEKIADVGVPVFMPDRPWNQGSVPQGVTRVYSWSETITGLRALLTKKEA